MPAKRVCLFTFIVLQIAASLALPPKSFAYPNWWCPDLTGDNFVNFNDFVVLANNWLQSGSSLPGDLDYNTKVDINDIHWFSIWWLNYCNDWPSGFCTDCKYPDCNLMNCTTPPEAGSPYCESTPPFIKVTLTGNTACGCLSSPDIDDNGERCSLGRSSYTTGNFDGSYIVPSSSYGQWYGVYDIENVANYNFDGLDCTYPHGGSSVDWVEISVERNLNQILITFTAYSDITGQHRWDLAKSSNFAIIVFGNTVSADDSTNCIEKSINDALTCENVPRICYINTWWAGGTATITVPP